MTVDTLFTGARRTLVEPLAAARDDQDVLDTRSRVADEVHARL
jgi:hypothetical protein